MFSRIREAVKIIGYREPQTGPDFVVTKQQVATTSGPGRVISHILELTIAVYTLGYLAGHIGERLTKLIPSTRSLSINTLTGAIGVLLAVVLNMFRAEIESKIRSHVNLADILAPYFGHRIEHTLRVLKG
jgi:hypothetical protein